MTTISVAYEVPAATIQSIREMLDETAMRDVNWNGVDFKITRGDFTSIEDDDSADAVTLLHRIFEIIDQR